MVQFADSLAPTDPIALTVRDGLRLHGYLTRPPGFRAPGPVVLLVHGGHRFRDYWGYSSFVQFLPNRGYAGLQGNYRGSDRHWRALPEVAGRGDRGKSADALI